MKHVRGSWSVLLALLIALPGLAPEGHGAELLRRIEIPSSFNPVGSGARALGMGGAFIAVADDATAASWNPGGLIQLERPEISMVLEGVHRVEEIAFAARPEGDGRETVSSAALNYMSAAYPFTFMDRNMVVSLNYQRLFDFTRQWSFDFASNADGLVRTDRYDYLQDGELTALGLAFAVEITPLFSLGITLNRWDDDITPNQWEQEVAFQGAGLDAGMPFSASYRSLEKWSFEGTSVNIGMLWRLSADVTVGAVFKSPFDADVRHESRFRGVVNRDGDAAASVTDFTSVTSETLEMPMSFGVGVAWQITREFRAALDVYRTQWDDFVLRDAAGRASSPVTGGPLGEAGVDPTHQVRVGVEYLFITDRFILPLTAGVFYDPAPAPGSPDDIYGFSVGSGVGWGRFHFDLAYQFRFGNDIGGYVLKEQGFSQDLREHLVYGAVVVHF